MIMKKIFSMMLASIALASCVDTVILPDNKIVDEDFWQKKSEVEAVVTTAYAQLRDASAIRNMIIWGSFRSDELVATSTLPSSATYRVALAQIYSMNIDPENAFTTWYPFYSAINYCNLVLEKAESVIAIDPDYTQGDYDANKAQVLALRAFCYFYLTRVFHDIPVTSGAYLNSSDDLNAPQVCPDDVLTMCINDLEEAAKCAIPGSTYGDWRDKGYLNQDGINALLADIYLWRASVNRDVNDYQACVDYCDKVIKAKKEAYENDPSNRRLGADIEKPDYYLSDYRTMYANIFGSRGQNADESIFELQYNLSNSENSGLDQMYFRYRSNKNDGYGYLKASKMFGEVRGNVQEGSSSQVWKTAEDQRIYEYVYDAPSSTMEQFNIRKFVATSSSGLKTIESVRDSREHVYQNWILYRLTDVMLMKAEALVQLYEMGGKADDDTRNEEAYKICKFVNDRSLPEDSRTGSPQLGGTQGYNGVKDRMENIVLAERARELCFEGKRWFDLMRYNYRHTSEKADLKKKLTEGYVMNSTEFFELALRKYTVPTAMRAKIRDERYLYMPINQDEVDVNFNLVQNPVYKSSSKY